MAALLSSLSLAPILMLAAGPMDDKAVFHPPVELTAGGKSIQLIYPTPVLHDLDGDGQRELVLGDLIGRLHHCKLGESGSDTDWGAMVAFEVEGSPLRLNNW